MRSLIRLSARERYVSGALLLAMLFAQLLLALPLVMAHVYDLPTVVGLDLAVAIGAALLVGAAFRRAGKFRPGLTFGAYAHAFLGLALFRAVQGTWLLVTGRPWGKYARGTLPRADSVYDFVHAVLLALVGSACLLVYLRFRSRRGTESGRPR